MINITRNSIEIGIEKSLKILHITDYHLPFYCKTDTENIKRQGGTMRYITDRGDRGNAREITII